MPTRSNSEVIQALAARPLPFGKKPLRTFALAIALPALLLYVTSAVLFVGVLSMMAGEINRVEDSRGVQSVHAALDGFLDGLSDAVIDEGTWNEAYLNTVVSPDPAWMDTTWGATARLGGSYDTVLVTDQDGMIQFGENNLGAIRGAIGNLFPAARTMLRDLEKGIAQTGDATATSEFAADKDGTAGLAAISIHQSTPGEMSVPRQSRRILWIAKHLTPATLRDFALRYQTPLAVLTTGAPDRGTSSIALTDADGKVTGTVAWTPERPGDAAFAHALAIALGVFAVIGLALLLGLGVLGLVIRRRAAAIAKATVPAAQVSASSLAAVASTAGPAPAANDRRIESPIDGVVASDFVVEYQPIFDLRAETLIGVEALLRWKRPDGTLLLQETLPPVLCAALLDRAGLIAIRHATGELAPLLGLMLTIAVSPSQLQSPVFAEKIGGTLGATNLSARRLQLALDATLLPAADLVRQQIDDLRRTGVSIALDNYALGPSTADYLTTGFADRLRLSAAALAGIDTNPARHALVETTITAARAAGFAVTVPGVERKEDASRLLRLGCREFQGAFLAPPMPIAALTQLILAPARPAEVRRAS